MEYRSRSLQNYITFGDIDHEVGELDARIRDLPGRIQELRTRGYVFKSYLERKAEILAQQWADLRQRVTTEVDKHGHELRSQADTLLQRMPTLRLIRNMNELGAMDSAVSNLESRVEGVKQSIKGLYGAVKENIDQTHEQVNDLFWVLDQADGAAFTLYPAEAVVSAVKAQWLTGEKEGPKGIFYLTDERVLFEQREEMATKKTLFITREKKKVQEVKWEAPLRQVTSARARERGGAFLGIGKKEMLEVEFAPDAAIPNAMLKLDADSDPWQGLIGRVKSGDIAGERTTPKDKAAVEAARTAPTKCTNCGALLTQIIVKGMTEIKCEYCGAVMRL